MGRPGIAIAAVMHLFLSAAYSSEPARTNVSIVGHRGLLHHAPENTLANFRACLGLRVGFEVDVRRSKDGALVCIHDETVDRTTDGQGRVQDLTLLQLKRLDAGVWFHARFGGERIPTYAQLLELVAGEKQAKTLIAVDLKATGIEREVVETASKLRVLDQLLFIGAPIGDRDVRARLREADSRSHVACLANQPSQLQAALEDELSDWVYFRYLPSPADLVRVHDQGKRAFIAGPTVSGHERMNWLRAIYAGMDGILTDHALELAKLVRRNPRGKPGSATTSTTADVRPRELTYGKPAEVGMDGQKLDEAVALVRRSIADNKLRGAVLLVARKGKIILHEALGWRDLGREFPLQKDSLFRMASNSKAVTAAGILLLVQDGLIGLDDPVREYLPPFQAAKARGITLRQLLTHTSGLRIKPIFLSPLLESAAGQSEGARLLREVARFAEIGAEVQPGASYSYNNAGYNTLAAVIEAVTGSYKEHLRTRIYLPLGMQDSCNHETDADHSRMSSVVRRKDDGSWETRWQPGDPPDYPFPRGSGGMISTAHDYAVFCQMLLNQGMYNGRRILSARLVEEATNPQLSHIPAAATYGLGWVVTERGGTFSHSGSDGTWGWVDPQQEIIGLVFTQTQNKTTPRKVFREMVNRACQDQPALAEP